MSTKAFGEHVHVMHHPLVAHKLTIMRDKSTSVKDFRELVSEIGMLITYEATRDLPLTTKTVETPICTAEEPTLAGKKIAVVPILRAGLGLVDGVLRMVPSARVGHIGMFRDEETLEPADSLLCVSCFLALLDKPFLKFLFRYAGSCDNANGPGLCRRFSGSRQQRLIVFVRQVHPAVQAEVCKQIRLRF